MVAIITAVNCSFYGILLVTGAKKVMTQMANGKQTPSLMLPEWVFTIFLPIGCVFLLLHTIEYCMDFLSKKEEADAQ
jgi:TRAP-type C4-dicarboxylate transport system permease small subunit